MIFLNNCCLYFKVYITGGSIANTEIDAVEVIDLDLKTIDSLKNQGESYTVFHGLMKQDDYF